MKDDRFRVVVDDSYALAIGRAMFIFSELEWNVVWCCERLSPGYLKDDLEKKTAGNIARDFKRLASMCNHDQDLFLSAGSAFANCVTQRNGLAHSEPCTAPGPDKAQRLTRNGTIWSQEAINDVADQFAGCSITFNAFLYNQLKADLAGRIQDKR